MTVSANKKHWASLRMHCHVLGSSSRRLH